jgi:hypothetical protein
MPERLNKPTIFVDLDGTLIWTWTPLITSASIAQVMGLPISIPPKRKEGYLKLAKVPYKNGKYILTCHRPNVGRFLRSLRTIGEVCLLTHAPREYAHAMNRAFHFGFTNAQIFTLPADYLNLYDRFGTSKEFSILVDDEGPGWCRRWRDQTSYERYDHRAESRHRQKCHCIGFRPGSHRDIAYPPFSGLKDDLFLLTTFRRGLVQRIAKVLLCSTKYSLAWGEKFRTYTDCLDDHAFAEVERLRKQNNARGKIERQLTHSGIRNSK